MARAGHDYATADTQTKTKPGTKSPGSRPGRAKTAGAKATSRIKQAGRKTAAKLKKAPEAEAKASEEAATEVAASVEPALNEEQDEFTAAVHGAQRGDSESFRILYREVQPKLLRYLSFMVDSDAEDIASETWLQATRDFHKFTGDFDNFRGWMTTIARHRAMDHLRKSSRQAPVVDVPVEEFAHFASSDDTEARAMESIGTDDAVKMIASLPKDQAEAVMLRAVIGMDAKTAAAIVGKRAGAVRTAAYRGLKTLAKRLGVES